MDNSTWMTLNEVSEYLKCSRTTIKDMVAKNTIPFSLLADSPRFFKKSIDEWLLQSSSNQTKSKFKTMDGTDCNEKLMETIVRLSSLYIDKTDYIESKTKYINLKTNKVLFHIHPAVPNSSNKTNSFGIDLVIPDVDKDIPFCKLLKEVNISNLYGNWQANSGWLEGDGSRHTYRPAKAFHIGLDMERDEKHKAWDEVKALIVYAMNRNEETNNLTYRPDTFLKFLRNSNDEDLQELVDLLTKGKDGESRFTEELTGTSLYQTYYHQGEHRKYWHLIVAELQKFGGNTFSNIIRGGKGVSYQTILNDVCKRVKVKVNEYDTVINLERKLQTKIMEIALEKMDNKELKKLFEEMDFDPDNYDDLVKAFADMIENMSEKELKSIATTIGIKPTSFTKNAMVHALQIAIKKGGFKSYIIALKIMNVFTRRLLKGSARWTANKLLTKWMARFAGPIGWVVVGLWDAYDLSGPARRVTIPAVLQVAYMRTIE